MLRSFGTSALPAELDGNVTDEMHERRIYTNTGTPNTPSARDPCFRLGLTPAALK